MAIDDAIAIARSERPEEADMGGVVQDTTTDRSVTLPLATRLVQHLAPVAVVAVVVTAVLAFAYLPRAERGARSENTAVDSAAARADDQRTALEHAMERGDVAAARAAWREAYRGLRRNPDWRRLAQLGDKAIELASISGMHQAGAEDARRAYLGTLVRARAEGSVEGVLRATEGFATLGDRDVVEEGLRIADSLAARSQDPDARRRVAAFRTRLERPQAVVGRSGASATTWDP